jgi:hypothetical protein
VAEWARLLSECWVKPVAGSNPALPATKKIRPVMGVFSFQSRVPTGGMIFDPALPATEKNASIMDAFFFNCQSPHSLAELSHGKKENYSVIVKLTGSPAETPSRKASTVNSPTGYPEAGGFSSNPKFPSLAIAVVVIICSSVWSPKV